jgi:hypothetical protein
MSRAWRCVAGATTPVQSTRVVGERGACTLSASEPGLSLSSTQGVGPNQHHAWRRREGAARRGHAYSYLDGTQLERSADSRARRNVGRSMTRLR